MPTTDPRIDAYIRKAPEFARAILEHLRGVIHEGCPDVVESIKWSMPAFDHNGPLCGLAAFKAHCALRLWKGELLTPTASAGSVMGEFGHIESVDELPPRRTLVALVKKAARLNDAGVRAPWQEKRARLRKTRTPAPIVVPDDLRTALNRNKKAAAVFAAFPPSHRREYVEWIVGAKREETRLRRIATAFAQIAEGKSQNWKYERK